MKTNMLFRMFVTRVKPPPEKAFRFLDNDNTQISQILPCNQDTDLEVNRTEDVNEKALTKNIKGNPKVIKALRDIGDVDENKIPLVCRSKVKSSSALYLLSRNTAKEFASIIVNDVIHSNAPIVEVNPGPGFLTEELLKAGVPKIYMNENYEEFNRCLKTLMKKYGDRLVLRNNNLLQLNYIQHLDNKNNSKKMEDIFRGIDAKQWNEDPSMQIISAVPNKKFLYDLGTIMMNQYQYLSNFGRMILYIATKPSIVKIFEDIPDSTFHKPNNIFLRMMFSSKVLGSLPRESFFPWNLEIKKRRIQQELYLEDDKKMTIIRLEANKDFLSDNFNRHDALMWLYFLKSHVRRRDARIIPELEKLMPGCGRQLIRHNLNIYSRFSELTSYELLMLFKIVKSWAQFENSTFVEDLKGYFEPET